LSIFEKRRESSEQWSAEKLSTHFKVKEGPIKELIEHYNNIVVARDKKGNMTGHWDSAEARKYHYSPPRDGQQSA